MRALSFLFLGVGACSLLSRSIIPDECQGEAARCDGQLLVRCIEGVEFTEDCGAQVCNASEVRCGVCGDGALQAPEECDDGPNNSDTLPDACRTSCLSPSCGDDVTDSDEECDDGAENSDLTPDACRADCVSPTCGDGVTDTGEACDDGNLIDADACEADCTLPACSNGIIDQDELCFLPPEELSLGFFPSDVALRDLDNDGALDLIVLNFEGGGAVFFNSGDGQFTAGPAFASGDGSLRMAFADFDGDSVEDMAVTDLSADGVLLFLQTQPGVFTFSQTVATPNSNPVFVSAADLDGNGEADLVVSQNGLQRIDIFLQTNGQFSLQAPSLSGNFSPTTLVDLDGDQDLEIIAGASGGESARSFTNQGDGSFVTAQVLVALFDTGLSAVGDFDQDGDPDVAMPLTNNANASLIRLFRNDEGNLVDEGDLVVVDGPHAVLAVDLNQDGDPDLVSANQNIPGSASAILGLPGFNFGTPRTLGVLPVPAFVEAGDLDGDGFIDLALNAFNDLSVSVLFSDF